jgi:hypothetical protein
VKVTCQPQTFALDRCVFCLFGKCSIRLQQIAQCVNVLLKHIRHRVKLSGKRADFVIVRIQYTRRQITIGETLACLRDMFDAP